MSGFFLLLNLPNLNKLSGAVNPRFDNDGLFLYQVIHKKT